MLFFFQVNFAQTSNALALVVGPEGRVAAQLNKVNLLVLRRFFDFYFDFP